MVELNLYSYGPKTKVSVSGREVDVGPDLFIAVEGAGTFEGVSVERKVAQLLAEGKDPLKTARRVHRESTRRGHASITTSLQIQMEVRDCSRALSLLLVSPPFGSYLQESQRRARVDKSSLIIPSGLAGDVRDLFIQTAYELVEEYASFVGDDVAIEDARYILPLSTKTSLFISSSLENYIALIQLCSENKHKAYVPQEAREFAEKLTNVVKEIAPILLESRLEFRNRISTYPFPNPYKQSDFLMDRIVSSHNYPEEPTLIGFTCLADREADLMSLVASQDKETLDSANPLITATTLEPLSLVAYHQAVRHRTVPTAVEPIYAAVERACHNQTPNIVIPPSIRKNAQTKTKFIDAAGKALQTYKELTENGVSPSTAVLLVPQALRIYCVRMYNGFNLLHPTGFIATRSCSYAQWEERTVAYKMMQEVVRREPLLSTVIGEKCRHLGYCPEKDWCPIILKYHHYSDEMHKRFGEGG
ncbi:MAG: FAD-dependent thymidylate synthase [Candidatus Caldarchaeum sp.]|nr:FAD-dependent thymidylate synthase [Candidatus Caldarchaeum sp.]MDW8359795.1 FAD-dependent thymidylate synthase [Candidatus Caldarchaeum sp.]